MATFDTTIVDYERLQKADLEAQLVAIADLARLIELVEWGRRAPEADELDGDPELLLSLIWPLRTIAGEAVKDYRAHLTAGA